jgi:uncharacterized alpha-E superfamily protein
MAGPRAFALYETASALERAEASARVLAARARVGRRPPDGRPGLFAALAACAPPGLVPARGAGAAHLRRSLDQAARAGAAAGAALPEEVMDALAWAVAQATRQAGRADALDPQEVSRTVRREVAAIRGLIAHSMSRDAAWELLRLGTFLPRAGWVAALVGASARLASQPEWAVDAPWRAAAVITGADRALGDGLAGSHAAEFLLLDPRFPLSVACSLAEVESALFALGRAGAVGEPALAMARMAHSRLRLPDVQRAIAETRAAWLVDEVLDAIGALAGAAVPERSGAPGEGPPGKPVAAGAG